MHCWSETPRPLILEIILEWGWKRKTFDVFRTLMVSPFSEGLCRWFIFHYSIIMVWFCQIMIEPLRCELPISVWTTPFSVNTPSHHILQKSILRGPGKCELVRKQCSAHDLRQWPSGRLNLFCHSSMQVGNIEHDWFPYKANWLVLKTHSPLPTMIVDL